MRTSVRGLRGELSRVSSRVMGGTAGFNGLGRLAGRGRSLRKRLVRGVRH